jgi:hypothetical protein
MGALLGMYRTLLWNLACSACWLDRAVYIATSYGGIGVRVPVGARFSLYVVQTGTWANPASYPTSAEVFFPEDKAAGDWTWPLTSIKFRRQENMDLYIHSPPLFSSIPSSVKRSLGPMFLYCPSVNYCWARQLCSSWFRVPLDSSPYVFCLSAGPHCVTLTSIVTTISQPW